MQLPPRENPSSPLPVAGVKEQAAPGGSNACGPAPLYERIRDLRSHGFTIDWPTTLFIVITHLVFLVGTPLAYFYAPAGFWKIMLGWTIVHALVASLSTTVYAHRLIAHGAARKVSWPVHLLFGFIGQVLAIQGSVRRWAAMHIIHHGVDRNGKHHLDPYSATWFGSAWRNFLWSHVLTYFFFHPDSEATEKAYQAKNDAMLVWQDKLYLPLLVALNFIAPLVIGYALSGTLVGAIGLMIASIGGFIVAQHNTWTVNSVTHMWGATKGAISSARNNYIWMGPLGEGNHHADHHDYGHDYRNGFGWSGWLLDPTRYVILLLRATGLVKGLQRASKHKEAEILARRALQKAQVKSQPSRWQLCEQKLEGLK
ncbi:MAG: hypothetical protein HKO71_02125, partial [Pseudomonadales bacterium]|nr:hypothetical protein [Pseudomonadales bacterium]